MVKNEDYTLTIIYYLEYILFAGFILWSHLNGRSLKVHCELWFGLITPKLRFGKKEKQEDGKIDKKKRHHTIIKKHLIMNGSLHIYICFQLLLSDQRGNPPDWEGWKMGNNRGTSRNQTARQTLTACQPESNLSLIRNYKKKSPHLTGLLW